MLVRRVRQKWSSRRHCKRLISVTIPSDVHDPLGLNESRAWTTQKPCEQFRKRPHNQVYSHTIENPSNWVLFGSGVGQSSQDVRRIPAGVFDGYGQLEDIGSRQTGDRKHAPEASMEMNGPSRPPGRSRKKKSRSRISKEDGRHKLNSPHWSNLVPVCGTDAGSDQRSHQPNSTVPIAVARKSKCGSSKRARRRRRKLVGAQEQDSRDLSTLPAEGRENSDSNMLMRAVPSIDDRLAGLARTDCRPNVSWDRTQSRQGGGTSALAENLLTAHAGVRSYQHASWETSHWCPLGALSVPSRDLIYKSCWKEGDRTDPRRHQSRSNYNSWNSRPERSSLSNTKRGSANGRTGGRGQKRCSDASPQSAQKRVPSSTTGRPEVYGKGPTEEVRENARTDDNSVAQGEHHTALTKKEKIRLKKKQRLARKRAELRAQKAQAAPGLAESASAAAEPRPPAAPDGSSEQCPGKRVEPATDGAVAEPDTKITDALDGKPAVLSKLDKLKLKRKQRAAKKRAELRASRALLASESAADAARNSDAAVSRDPDAAVRRDSGGHEDWRCLAAELRGPGGAQRRDPRLTQGHNPAATDRSSHGTISAADPRSGAVERRAFSAAEKPDFSVAEKPDFSAAEKPDFSAAEKPDFSVAEKLDPAVAEKPDPAAAEKTGPAAAEKPDFSAAEKPDPVAEKPDPAAAEKPDFSAAGKPDLSAAEKPGPAAAEKPDFSAAEKPDFSAAEKPDSAAADGHDSDGAASRDSSRAERWDRRAFERRDSQPVNVSSAFSSELGYQRADGTALTKWEKIKLKRKQRRSKRRAELAASKNGTLSEQSGSARGPVVAGSEKRGPDTAGNAPDPSKRTSSGPAVENPRSAGSQFATPSAGQGTGDAGLPAFPAGAAEAPGETSSERASLTRLEKRKAKRRQRSARRAEEVRAQKAQATSEASAGASEPAAGSDAALAPPTPALRPPAETSRPATSPAPGQKRPGGSLCGAAQKRPAVETEGLECAAPGDGEPSARDSSAAGAAAQVNGQPLTKKERNRLKNRQQRARKRAERRARRAELRSGDGAGPLAAGSDGDPATAPSNSQPSLDRNVEPNDATKLLAGSSQPEKTVIKEVHDKIDMESDFNAEDLTRADSAQQHVLAGSSDAEATAKNTNEDAVEAGDHEGVPRDTTSSMRQRADLPLASVPELGDRAGSSTCCAQPVSEVLKTEMSDESEGELTIDLADLNVDRARVIVKTEERVARAVGGGNEPERQANVMSIKTEPQEPNDHDIFSRTEKSMTDRSTIKTEASVGQSSEEVADSVTGAGVVPATDEAEVSGKSDAGPTMPPLDAARSAADVESTASGPPTVGPDTIAPSGTNKCTAQIPQEDCGIASRESKKQQVQVPSSNNTAPSNASAPSEEVGRRAARYQYGNYDRYYGYRNASAADPRLAVMRGEWFQGLDVLDVGCNIGHITLTLARDFAPRKCVGIDIDASLVKIARKNVRHYVRKPAEAAVASTASQASSEPAASAGGASTGAAPPDTEDSAEVVLPAEEACGEAASLVTQASTEVTSLSSEASTQAASGTSAEVASPAAEASTEAASPAAGAGTGVTCPGSVTSTGATLSSAGASAAGQFPRNVSFVHGNFVLDSDALLETVRPEYDVILCLSVTKWVHLNFGDAGLRRLLRRMYLMLRPGGRLLLEPQPWSSYAKRRKLTERIAAVYPTLQLRPDQLPAELQQLGFLPPQLLQPPPAAARGFCRPLQLYRKPGENSAEAKVSSTTQAERTSTTESERPTTEPAGASC